MHVKLISDPAGYFHLLSSDKVNVTDGNFINDETIEAHFENVDEFIEVNGKTNVVIAAFTTAHACLMLYSIWEQLDWSVLYFDTDSIIYTSKEGEWKPPTGSYLGELLDELDGYHITTIVSEGPKNYSYQLNTDKTVCKVRGITLYYRTQQEVNFHVMSNMVRGVGPEKITVDILFKIVRDKNNKRSSNHLSQRQLSRFNKKYPRW